jgi:hypothetical protein
MENRLERPYLVANVELGCSKHVTVPVWVTSLGRLDMQKCSGDDDNMMTAVTVTVVTTIMQIHGRLAYISATHEIALTA